MFKSCVQYYSLLHGDDEVQRGVTALLAVMNMEAQATEMTLSQDLLGGTDETGEKSQSE